MGLLNWFKSKNNYKYISTLGVTNGEYLEIKTAKDVQTAYLTNPIVYSIVEKKASIFSKTIIKEISQKGEEIENSIFLEIIKNPNVLQGENGFLTEIGRQLALYHNCIIFVNRAIPNTFLRADDTLMVLDFSNCEINYKKNNFKDIKTKYDVIENVSYFDEITGKTIIFLPSELIFISSEKINQNDIYLKAAEAAINVINYKYSLLNSLYSRNGGFGIFSNIDSGVSSDFYNKNLTAPEKEELQQELREYSFKRGGKNYIITNRNIQYQPITYPISDLMLDENAMRAMTDIANVMNFEVLSLNSLDGSTYSNKENSDKNLINNSIIAMWDLLETALQKENLTPNTILVDYSHIPELQEDKVKEMEKIKINDEIQINRFNNNIITYNELRLALGLEEVTNGNYYKNDKIKNDDNISE